MCLLALKFTQQTWFWLSKSVTKPEFDHKNGHQIFLLEDVELLFNHISQQFWNLIIWIFQEYKNMSLRNFDWLPENYLPSFGDYERPKPTGWANMSGFSLHYSTLFTLYAHMNSYYSRWWAREKDSEGRGGERGSGYRGTG